MKKDQISIPEEASWEDQDAYAYWLTRRYNVRCQTKERLLACAGSPKDVYNMKEQHLEELNFLTQREKEILIRSAKEQPERLYECFRKEGGNFTCIGRRDYPGRLKPLKDRPFGFFYYGTLPADEAPAVGIVGARGCSDYGRAAAGSFADAIARAGAVVVSGMACGIDRTAGEAALDAGGTSCAVLGCGIDICYPESSFSLYWRLRREGCVLSEYPPGTAPLARHFPARNRIISALSDKLLVIEARKKSGSLITADMALEQGRDVFAVPGRISDPLSRGCNELIRQGAGVALSPQSLLLDMGIFSSENINKCKKNENSLAKEEKLLYSCVDLRPLSLEELTEKSGLSVSETMELLLNLQLKGYISEASRNHYVRTALDAGE